jgi:hypothetical protein
MGYATYLNLASYPRTLVGPLSAVLLNVPLQFVSERGGILAQRFDSPVNRDVLRPRGDPNLPVQLSESITMLLRGELVGVKEHHLLGADLISRGRLLARHSSFAPSSVVPKTPKGNSGESFPWVQKCTQDGPKFCGELLLKT